MEKCRMMKRKFKKASAIAALMLISSAAAFAQTTGTADGSKGIQDANTKVRGYFGDGVNLMYGIGGILALIGAVKVYQKWNAGEPDTSKVAASWFGSCIFLVVVATIIKSFFGI